MTDHHHGFFIGIVIICPATNKQIALHKKSFGLKYWNAGLAGHEMDIEIKECPMCGNKHILSTPIS